MLFAASYLGIPVSTTHTITGCGSGAGAARRASAVNWGNARSVMVAWVITTRRRPCRRDLYWVVTDIVRGIIALEAVALIVFSIYAGASSGCKDGWGRLGAALAWCGFVAVALA
jgi:PiT family inorganic phosphate transporter